MIAGVLISFPTLVGAGYFVAQTFLGARDSLDEAEVLTDVLPEEAELENSRGEWC